MPNRLASETSPYLLQHKDNPVDWYPWGDEAFKRAKDEEKPIFLSVGYSSCHWCHVMERESFEDEEIAKLLNDSFISIKVDREERPDVDEAYMAAVQLMSGRGGWPMTAFLTPDRKPFFAGTYFPKENRGKYIGFKSLLQQLSVAWKAQRSELQKAADEVSDALEDALASSGPQTFTQLGPELFQLVVGKMASEFDRENGGFGPAPKFPPHSAIEFLLLFAIQPWTPDELREPCLGMLAFTLEKVIFGGLHDHVGGGFHRYSTDDKWIVPHFEKMLCDNALMLGNLARCAGILGQIDPKAGELYIATAEGIVDWVAREMTAPEGWFYSSLDADTEGEEGRYYTWTLADVAGSDQEFLDAYHFGLDGNYRDETTGEPTGRNIPYLTDDQEGRFDEDLARLLLIREKRMRPARDDKALVSWNGLMIGSLAEIGMLSMAEKAALAILDIERKNGHLPHLISMGRPVGLAYLDDYACLADGILKLAGLVDLLQERGQAVERGADFWGGEAARLTDQMIARFYDEDRGGFFSTSEEHEELFGRSKPVFDQPIPSGNAIAIRLLIALGLDEMARKCAQPMVGWIERAPTATEALSAACLGLVQDEPLPESVPAPTTPSADVQISISSRELQADSSGLAKAQITIEVPEGFHINSPEPPARWLVPTKVTVNGAQAKIAYPPAADEKYSGRVTIEAEISLGDGREKEFEVSVSYQACTESECLLPGERRFDCVIFR